MILISARRTWLCALLVLALTASCSAKPGPARTPDPSRAAVPGHPSPAASPGPGRAHVKVRVAARFRVPIASSGPAVVIGDDLWIAFLREPIKRFQATMNPGHLVDLDTRTGHVRRVLEIGSLPSGIVASGHHIWIPTIPGDLHPPDRQRDIVTELDRNGSIIRRYHVHDPEAITPAKNGVWVTSFTGRDGTSLHHLHDGRADPAIPLQDAVGGGRTVLAECPDGLYTATTDIGTVTVTRFSHTGTNPHSVRLDAAGYAELACTDHGVVAITSDTITRITARGKATQTTRPPGPIAGAAVTPGKIWLLTSPEKNHRSTLTAVDPRTGTPAEPRSIPAAASITADGTDLWTTSADGRVFKIETH